jgi:F-type H+-transporting ATPase subunit beta
VGKTVVVQELINTLAGSTAAFGVRRVGERTREGNALYREMQESGEVRKDELCSADERPPGARPEVP